MEGPKEGRTNKVRSGAVTTYTKTKQDDETRHRQRCRVAHQVLN
jgi:hypothetical protein